MVTYTVPGMKNDSAERVVRLLQDRLNSLNDLALTLKHVHWNVVGPHFIGVHQMLDRLFALVEVVGRLRLPLGDAQNCKVGKDLAHRHVDRHGPALAPLADRPGHTARPRLEHAHILDAQPCLTWIGTRGRALPQLFARLGDPIGAPQLDELLVELILQGQQVIDVGGRIEELLSGQRTA